MTEADSIHLPTQQQAIDGMLRQNSHASAIFQLWGKIITGAGVACAGGIVLHALTLPASEVTLSTAVLLILFMTGSLAVGLGGISVWVSGIFLRSDLAHYQAIRFAIDEAERRRETPNWRHLDERIVRVERVLADDDALVEALSAEADSAGSKVVRMVRPSRPEDRRN